MSHLVGFWPLRVGLQAGGPYGPPLAAVAVDSVAWPPGRAKDRLNRATAGVQTNKNQKKSTLRLGSFLLLVVVYV